jgi:hypothetical protein
MWFIQCIEHPELIVGYWVNQHGIYIAEPITSSHCNVKGWESEETAWSAITTEWFQDEFLMEVDDWAKSFNWKIVKQVVTYEVV